MFNLRNLKSHDLLLLKNLCNLNNYVCFYSSGEDDKQNKGKLENSTKKGEIEETLDDLLRAAIRPKISSSQNEERNERQFSSRSQNQNTDKFRKYKPKPQTEKAMYDRSEDRKITNLQNLMSHLVNLQFNKTLRVEKSSKAWKPYEKPILNDRDGVRLNIFRSKSDAVSSGVEALPESGRSLEKPDPRPLTIMDMVESHEHRQLVLGTPHNEFERMMNWTRDNILWRFPIDNDQDSPEADVGFHEHVFPQRYLQQKQSTDVTNKDGEALLSQFLWYVCLGLSANPHLSVEQKQNHLRWYNSYFKDKAPLVQLELKKMMEHKQFRDSVLKG